MWHQDGCFKCKNDTPHSGDFKHSEQFCIRRSIYDQYLQVHKRKQTASAAKSEFQMLLLLSGHHIATNMASPY